MSITQNHQTAKGARLLSLLLLGALVPACHHNSSGTSGGGSGGGSPLTISNLTVEPGANFALVTWETNQPSDSRVDWGLTPQYTNTVAASDLVTTHSLLVTGLQPSTDYHFNGLSETPGGLSAETGDGTFMTTPRGLVLGDDFNRFNLNRDLWTYMDPHSRGQLRMIGAGTDDARVVLSVPDNIDYRPENGALRLSQSVADISPTEVEAKFLNPWTIVDGKGGLYLESDAANYSLFGFRFDGADLLLEASQFAGGALNNTQTSFVNAGPLSAPIWLRVAREGNQYQSSYSFDGASWMNGPVAAMSAAPTSGGLFAANGPGTVGQFNLATDYVFDNLNRPPFEDVGVPGDNDPPYIYRYEVMALSDSAGRIQWWTDEPTGGVARFGLTPQTQGGVEFLLEPGYANSLILPSLDPGSLYYVNLLAGDERGQSETLEGLTFMTPGVGGGNPAVRVWNGWDHPTFNWNFQSFALNGNAQDRVNVTGKIFDEDEARIDLNDTLVWSLNSGPENVAILGDDPNNTTPPLRPWRLAGEGDFNIVLPVSALSSAPLVDGRHKNELRLVVTDDDGNVGIKTVFVLWSPNTSWPRNYMTDFMSGALDSKSGHQSQIQVVDGDWYIDQHPQLGFSLRTNPKRLGYDRIFALGEALSSTPWDNYEAVIPFTIMGFDLNGFTPGTGSYAFGVVNRWNAHQDGGPFAEPKHGIYPLSSLYTYRWFDLAGNENWQIWENENQNIHDFTGPTIVPGDNYLMKVRVETLGDGRSRHSLKVWPLGSAEPTDWTQQQTTAAGQGPNTGSLAIFAHHVDLLVGDITVTGL